MFERLQTIARHERYALLILAIGLPVAFGCYATAALSAPAQMVIVAWDNAGNEYVAGRGDTCDAAWEQAVLPGDLAGFECVPEATN